MRRVALICFVFAVVSATSSGCTPGANDELKDVVEEAFPSATDSSSCEWGSSSFESEPKSWYGCWAYLHGVRIDVADTIAAQLVAHGFNVTRNPTQFTVELTALRDADTVCVDVLAPGFVRGRNTLASEVNPDSDEVFVDVWTTEPRNADANRCAGLPGWDGPSDSSEASPVSEGQSSTPLPVATPWRDEMSVACSDLGAELTHLEPPADREGLIRYLHRVLALERSFDVRIASLEPAPMDAAAADRVATARRAWESALARARRAAQAGETKAALEEVDRARSFAQRANISLESLKLTQCLLPSTGIPG